MNEVQVLELGLQEYTDPSGETTNYYAVAFTLQHEGQEYTLVKSLDPDTTPEDPEYQLAIETGKQRLLAKVLQDVSDEPAQESASE